MKKIFLLLTFITVFSGAFAQFGYLKITEVKLMKNQQLLVVLTDNKEYNALIDKVMKKYWTFNPYITIKKSDISTYNHSADFAFLVYATTGGSKIKKSGISADWTNDAFFLASAITKSNDLQKPHVLAASGIDETLFNASLEAEIIRNIQILNEYCNSSAKKSTDKEINFQTMKRNYLRGDLDFIHSKKLIIANEDYVQTDTAVFYKIYTFEGKLVSKADIAKAIIEGHENVVYVTGWNDGSFSRYFFQSAKDGAVIFMIEKQGIYQLNALDIKSKLYR